MHPHIWISLKQQMYNIHLFQVISNAVNISLNRAAHCGCRRMFRLTFSGKLPPCPCCLLIRSSAWARRSSSLLRRSSSWRSSICFLFCTSWLWASSILLNSSCLRRRSEAGRDKLNHRVSSFSVAQLVCHPYLMHCCSLMYWSKSGYPGLKLITDVIQKKLECCM